MSLSFADRENLWIQAGGNPASAAIAAAVSMAENTPGEPSLVNSTNDVGLWQINQPSHPEYSTAWLQNPLNNAKAAVAISNNGANWSPWVTYKSGAYLQYLSGSTNGASTLSSSSSSCSTSTLNLGSIGPVSIGSVCLDGFVGIGACIVGLQLAISGIVLLAIILTGSAAAKTVARNLGPLTKVATMVAK